jgi:branched-chain amino acid transport system permease protein
MRTHALRDSLGGVAVLGVPLAIVALVATAVASPSEMRTVVNFLITVTLVVALQSFSGNSGIISFGHVAFMGIGAYVGALVTIPEALKESQLPSLPSWIAGAELGYVPALLVGALVAALVAAVLAIVLARMAEGAMAMATIGVLFVFFNVFENWDAVTRGSSGVFGVPQSTDVWSALAFALVAIAVAIAFRSSSWGMQLRASAVDPVAAEALGVRVVRLRYVAWIVSAALMGLGGAVWSQYNLAFDPSQFYLPLTFTLLAIVVVGGIGSVSGVVVGAALITVVQEIMRRVEEDASITGLTQITVALLILAVLYARPTGLVGSVELNRRLGPLLSRRSGGADRA